MFLSKLAIFFFSKHTKMYTYYNRITLKLNHVFCDTKLLPKKARKIHIIIIFIKLLFLKNDDKPANITVIDVNNLSLLSVSSK